MLWGIRTIEQEGLEADDLWNAVQKDASEWDGSGHYFRRQRSSSLLQTMLRSDSEDKVPTESDENYYAVDVKRKIPGDTDRIYR